MPIRMIAEMNTMLEAMRFVYWVLAIVALVTFILFLIALACLLWSERQNRLANACRRMKTSIEIITEDEKEIRNLPRSANLLPGAAIGRHNN